MTTQTQPPLHLLMVDDDDQLRETLVRRFQRLGMTVTAADSAEEALAKVAQGRWDVALLDLHLPGMSGIDLLQRLKELEALQAELERSARFCRPFSLLFIDLDHFKAINDRHGHGIGDLVLQSVARAVGSSLRPADILGRYGGEEFLVGLVETDGPSARGVAERIRRQVAGTVCACAGYRLSLTVSIGLATLKRDEAEQVPLEKMIDRADRAMYQAKQAGRDHVCVYQSCGRAVPEQTLS